MQMQSIRSDWEPLCAFVSKPLAKPQNTYLHPTDSVHISTPCVREGLFSHKHADRMLVRHFPNI